MKRPVVIFDMDGVLINSIPEHFRSYRVLFARRGIKYEFSEFHRHDITSGVMHVIPRVMKEHGKPFDLPAMVKEKNSILKMKNIELFEGVPELIKSIKKNGYKTAVASGGSREFLNKILKKRKIYGYFDLILTGDDHVRKKPYPDIYKKTAEAFGVHPADCVVIEDTYDGVLAAKRAGMKVIGHKVPAEEQNLSRADCVVKSMAYIDIKLILRVWSK